MESHAGLLFFRKREIEKEEEKEEEEEGSKEEDRQVVEVKQCFTSTPCQSSC